MSTQVIHPEQNVMAKRSGLLLEDLRNLTVLKFGI